MSSSKPFYDLKIVKEKINNGEVLIRSNALESARWDFGWGPEEIKRCFLRLNPRDYKKNREKNHFFKTEAHWTKPHTMMDYYKAKKILDGENVYIHFYIRNGDCTLVVSSFKELEF